jgi:hypothetical protein
VLQRELRLQHAIVLAERDSSETADSPASDKTVDLLLGQCRSELAESLDDAEARAARLVTPSSRWTTPLSPVRAWQGIRNALVYHPALSMAVLVLVSFMAGVAGQQWRSAPVAESRPAITVSAAPKITEQQLQSAGSANVTWATPAGSQTPTVQVQLMSQTPMSIVGAPEDADVRRALTFVLSNGQRFDPDARLDSLEVLASLSHDQDVLQALCAAARSDANPGVRIKALETLQGLDQDAQVRDTLLAALKNDSNSGVRVQAINQLLSALPSEEDAGHADAQLVDTLRDRLRNDSNRYVRLQSAAALRELGLDGQ